ncbi:MAG: uL15 family ribosomal protein [Patescibacteria group bacterium]
MQTHNLKRNKANRKAKQVGRGGTRGKTSGRGTKGQNARSGRKKRPEMRDFIKRLPKLRGRGKNYLKSRKQDYTPISLSALDTNFGSGDTVSSASLLAKGLISTLSGKTNKVKVLGGSIKKALTIEKLAISKSARNSIEMAGGKVV